MTKKKKFIIGASILVVIIAILLLMRGCQQKQFPDSSGTKTTEQEKKLDFIPANANNENINIPGMTGLYMVSGQKKQIVDFYNPDTNNCYFKISLHLSDDTLIYESDYIEPSEHVIDIELTQELEKGIYKNSYLLYECFTLDDAKEPLNSAQVILEINSK